MDSKPYIVIAEEDDVEPKENELGLDFGSDIDYNTPYTTYGEDNFDVGEVFEVGGIFDDR